MEKFMPSMLFSKEFGMRHLHEHLKGVPGVDVIPYREYEQPGDFDPSHFPKRTKRFLVRSEAKVGKDDPKKAYLYGFYWHAPRIDPAEEPASAKGVPRAIAKTKRRWDEYVKGRTGLFERLQHSVIVHPTVPREDIKAHGRIVVRRDQGKWKFMMMHHGQAVRVTDFTGGRDVQTYSVGDEKVWRDFLIDMDHIKAGRKSKPAQLSTLSKLTTEHLVAKHEMSPEVARAIVAAVTKLHEATKGLEENGARVTAWETDYAVPEQTGRPEFYDFIVHRISKPRKRASK